MAHVNPLITAIKAGSAPKMIKMAAAQGALPFPPEILLGTQVILTTDQDSEVSQAAIEGIRRYSPQEILATIELKATPEEVLDFCGSFFINNQQILEKVILHPSTPHHTIAILANKVSQSLAELIISNQVRLIEAPEIIQALRQNPNLSPGNRKRLNEIEHDFLGDSAQAQFPVTRASESTVLKTSSAVAPLSAEELNELDARQVAAESIPTPGDPATTPSAEEMSHIEEIAAGDDDKLTLYQKIASLPISGKIKLAILGKREERSLLIRDANRLVAVSVMASPKLNDSEVEVYSQLRNINDEVLRLIAITTQWTKNYRICLNLVKNPRAPLAQNMQLMNRLTTIDLRILLRDRQTPAAIRQQAQRILNRRQT